jgi:U3 small nucleolar RNA-associated protein 14
MPGRQSTGAQAYVKPKSKDRKKNRSLNALAIAEKQVPTHSKSSIDREKEAIGHKSKRRRTGKDGDSGNEGELRKGKKRKGGQGDRGNDQVERGSDSEGNEWLLGGVNSDNDSDLDSDEAFGESDEEKFEGFMLRGSSTMQPHIKSRSKPKSADMNEHPLQDIDLREDGNSPETLDESDGLGDDAIDLAAMLDEGAEQENEGLKTISRAEEGSVSSDEDSIFTDSDMEDDQPNSTQLESLQRLVSTIDKNTNTLSQSNRTMNAEESMAPSQFGINSTKKLTVADLIPSITDSNLKRSLKLLVNNDSKTSSKTSGIPKKLDVPLAKRQQDRLNRAAAYNKSKETLNRWIETVKFNRRAEHLAFPLQDPNAGAAPGTQKLLPLIHSQPVTDLECVIQNILQDSGLAPRGPGSEGDADDVLDGLQTNKLSLREVQARRAELRRARELLFREEVRSRRIKKIKSKSYRKIHRKERERIAQQERVALAAAGLDDPDSEQERMDRRRAEERVGARHRESKWAKGVKDSGRAAWDEEARGGMVETARRADELTKRIQGRDFRRDESSLSSSESDSDDVAPDKLTDEKQDSLNKLRRRVSKIQNHNDLMDSSKVEPKSGLSSMKFMAKADALRKERNDADLQLLRREAAGEDTPNEEEPESGRGRRHFGPTTTQIKSSKSFQKEIRSEFEERDESASGDDPQSDHPVEEQQIIVDSLPTSGLKSSRTRDEKVLDIKRGQQGKENEGNYEAVTNPWLSSAVSSRHDNLQSKGSQADAIITTALAAQGSVGQVSGSESRGAPKISHQRKKPRKPGQTDLATILAEVDDSNSDDDNSNLPPAMKDQELIRKAFAGDEVVADFEKEKRDTTGREEEQVIDNALPGWGNWTGAGISKKEQKRNRGKNVSKVDGIPKEKRRDAKLDRVIINEKRVVKVGYLPALCRSSAEPLERQVPRVSPTVPLRKPTAVRKVPSPSSGA